MKFRDQAMALRVFIGYDSREPDAYTVAAHSLWRTSGIRAVKLDEPDLRRSGLFTRPVVRFSGRLFDVISGVPQSTEFALTRFLVPILSSSGWALFTDCDVVFMRDVNELLSRADPTKAVMVVQHEHVPSAETKMVDQVQRRYPRKNWSSVMLWNLDHPANKRLTTREVNSWHRDELHLFGWLEDDEIGALQPEWNWLVGEQPKPAAPAIAHFTLGGPFLKQWPGAEHDDIWYEAAAAYLRDRMLPP